MSAKTEHCHLDSELTLSRSTTTALTVRAIALSLTKQDDELIECRLTFCVNPEIYKHIDTEGLFNLKQEIRGSSTGEFLPEVDISIEISLKPDLLTHLIEHAADANQAATYILNLSGEQPDDPLLFTENWLGLSVKQQQESGEMGYSTFWAYINPSAIASGATSSEEIGNAIAKFFAEWTEANFSTMAQKATSQTLDGIVNFFQELADVSLDTLAQAATSSRQIFKEIVNFFTEDDWPFTKIQGEPMLQMAFQGENGKWNCYAKAREEQEQFIFYSVCPVNAPEDKRLAVAEFLTRANSGMIIGNFEMDFEDGEICYKTSIDVEGDSISFALIKKLVYANVTIMDQYLPGIIAVIEGNVSAKDAIAQIEAY